MLNYLIKHHKEIIAFLAIIGGCISFIVGMYKWIDIRRREEKHRRFEQFHKIFEWVAGRTANGNDLVNTQQAMAVYELSEFPEYKHLSLPILDYYITESSKESDDSLFRKALLETKLRLQKKADPGTSLSP